MKQRKIKNPEDISQVIDEVTWNTKYILSGLNVLRSRNIDSAELVINGNKILKLDEFGYLTDDNDDDNFYYSN